MNSKPIIVVSKCLGFDACRYNGQMQKDEFLERLKDKVEFITVCPEISIGLKTPRESIRIINDKDRLRLIDPKSGKEFLNEMIMFGEEFLSKLDKIDGFILKSRSPSCGIKDVKIYNGLEKSASFKKGVGIFANIVMNKYSNLAIEDEGRLRDYKIREHFLTKLYTLYKFRLVKEEKNLNKTINFHNNNKMLFIAYNNKEFNELNKIMSKKFFESEDIELYENHLGRLLSKCPRYTSNIKILIIALNKFKHKISLKETNFIVECINKYKSGHIPFSVPLYLIKSYAVRLDEQELLNQSFFNPYPESLLDVRDSGKILT